MELTLKRKGFLYFFAYGCWNYFYQDSSRTNLCRFFWRCVAALFIGWPIVVPFMFLMKAQVPTRNGRRELRNWPDPDGAGPFPVLIFAAFSLGLIATMIYDLGILLGFAAFPSFVGKEPGLPPMAFVFGCLGWVFAFVFAGFFVKHKFDEAHNSGRWAKSELRPGNILSKFLGAKKAKLCPIIKIV